MSRKSFCIAFDYFKLFLSMPLSLCITLLLFMNVIKIFYCHKCKCSILESYVTGNISIQILIQSDCFANEKTIKNLITINMRDYNATKFNVKHCTTFFFKTMLNLRITFYEFEDNNFNYQCYGIKLIKICIFFAFQVFLKTLYLDVGYFNLYKKCIRDISQRVGCNLKQVVGGGHRNAHPSWIFII